MCGSSRIKLGSETLHIKRGKTSVRVAVRRWACPACGEKFLTAASRGKIDAMIMKKPNRRKVA
jgi:YgiT-type zinc finger domain-containing protein